MRSITGAKSTLWYEPTPGCVGALPCAWCVCVCACVCLLVCSVVVCVCVCVRARARARSRGRRCTPIGGYAQDSEATHAVAIWGEIWRSQTHKTTDAGVGKHGGCPPAIHSMLPSTKLTPHACRHVPCNARPTKYPPQDSGVGPREARMWTQVRSVPVWWCVRASVWVWVSDAVPARMCLCVCVLFLGGGEWSARLSFSKETHPYRRRITQWDAGRVFSGWTTPAHTNTHTSLTYTHTPTPTPTHPHIHRPPPTHTHTHSNTHTHTHTHTHTQT